MCRYQHGTKADKLYDRAEKLDVTATLDLGAAGVHEVAFYHLHQKHVDFVFVDHPVYHRADMLLAVQLTGCMLGYRWSSLTALRHCVECFVFVSARDSHVYNIVLADCCYHDSI